LELPAYCGHEAAIVLSGYDQNYIEDMRHPFSDWLSGLASRWPGVMVRAAAAAGRVALANRMQQPGCALSRPHDGDCLECLAAEEADCESKAALEACEAWIACPCEEHREAWRALSHDLPPWVPHEQWKENIDAQTLRPAASETSPEAVREAIQAALIPWALGRST
jgi:hypothetical protein